MFDDCINIQQFISIRVLWSALLTTNSIAFFFWVKYLVVVCISNQSVSFNAIQCHEV